MSDITLYAVKFFDIEKAKTVRYHDGYKVYVMTKEHGEHMTKESFSREKATKHVNAMNSTGYVSDKCLYTKFNKFGG